MKKLSNIVKIGALALTSATMIACANGNSQGTEEKSLSFSTQIKNLEEYIDDDNECPLNLDKEEGVSVFTFDSWSLEGTKVEINDDGEAVGCYWDIKLDLEEKAGGPLLDYKMEFHYHAAHSEKYTEDVDAYYSYYGTAFAISKGYHLSVADWAEAKITGEAFEETAGWGAGDDSNAHVKTMVGPNGGTLYYYYVNTDLQNAGYSFGFPFMGQLVSTFYENDTIIEGNEIKGWENVDGVCNSYDIKVGLDTDAVNDVLGEYGLIDVAVEADNDMVHNWSDASGAYKLAVTADGDVAKYELTYPDGYEAYTEEEIANLTEGVDYVRETGFFNRTYYYKLDANGNKIQKYSTVTATSSVYNKISGVYTVVFPGIGMMNADETVTITFNSDGSIQLVSSSKFGGDGTKFYLASTIAEDEDITKTTWTAKFDDGMGSQNPVSFDFAADGTVSMKVTTSTGSGTSESTYSGTYTNNKGVVTVRDVHNTDPEYALGGSNATKYYPSVGVWGQLDTPITGVNKMGQTTSNPNNGDATIILLEGGSFVFGPAPAAL